MKYELISIQIFTIGDILFILALNILEIKRTKNLITPFVLASIPFVVIFFISNFFLLDFEFPPITIRAQLFITFCLLILWLIGQLFAKFNLPPLKNVFSKFSEDFYRYESFLLLSSWIIIFIAIKYLLVIFRQHGGFAYFGDPMYEKQMTMGLIAHLIQIAKVLFLFLIFIYKRARYKFLIICTLILLFFIIAANQVKYHLIFVIAMAFFFYIIEKPLKKQFRLFFFSGVAFFVIMNLFWIMLTLAWGTFGLSNKGVWEFFVKQTMNYFVTSPMVLNTWLSHPGVKPSWTLLTVFINIFNFVVGNPIKINVVPLVNLYFQQTAPNLYSNVGTAFGVYYLIGGLPFTVFMTILTGGISYILYFYSLKKYNPILIYFNLLFLVFWILSFFVQYFTLLSIYEMTVIFILFILGFKIFNKLQKLINSYKINE